MDLGGVVLVGIPVGMYSPYETRHQVSFKGKAARSLTGKAFVVYEIRRHVYVRPIPDKSLLSTAIRAMNDDLPFLRHHLLRRHLDDP